MMTLEPTPGATRNLRNLLITALVISGVHYADNFVRYDRYTSDDPSIIGTLIVRPVVPISWLAFAAAAIWGYREFCRGRRTTAALGVAIYSTSGLASLLHFVDVSFRDLDAFQIVGVIADFAQGVATFAAAAWIAYSAPTSAPAH